MASSHNGGLELVGTHKGAARAITPRPGVLHLCNWPWTDDLTPWSRHMYRGTRTLFLRVGDWVRWHMSRCLARYPDTQERFPAWLPSSCEAEKCVPTHVWWRGYRWECVAKSKRTSDDTILPVPSLWIGRVSLGKGTASGEDLLSTCGAKFNTQHTHKKSTCNFFSLGCWESNHPGPKAC